MPRPSCVRTRASRRDSGRAREAAGEDGEEKDGTAVGVGTH